jgi:hypothetical protein
MFDVNQITTTLRGMGDRALQQYAMMNKANPYVLSLAVAESNQRKQLRSAAQARAMAPQPKVADSAIAGIAEAPPAVDAMGNVTGMAAGGLPEDQGIGRLPARNIQHMADGGIAGFDESTNAPITTKRLDSMGNTDGMFNYAQDGGSVVQMAGGGVPGYAAGVYNKERFKEFLKAKNIDEKAFSALDFSEKEKVLDEFKNKTSGPQKPVATPATAAATPTAAQPSNSGTGYDLGKKVGPTLEKVGEKLSNIGTTKTSKLPLGGSALSAGALGAVPAVYEGYTQGDFYNDPNVSNLGKAKQALGTAAKVGIPTLTTGLGSLIGPWGTAAGMLGGGALTAYLDQTGNLTSQEYDDWLKANPQAKPEEKKKVKDELATAAATVGQDAGKAATATPEAAPSAGTGGASAPRPTGASDIQSMYELFAGPKNQRDTQLNDIERQYKELAESKTSAAQRDYTQLQADLAARGEYGKDKEARLKGKGERIAKEEGQSGGLALLEAGLAMMAGTSQNAFANIGQGAMAGTAAYRKSLDKLTDARDKLDDAYGRLEDVRFNQKSMDAKELRAAKKDIDNATNSGLESLINFTAKRFDINRDEAGKLLGSYTNLKTAEIGAAPKWAQVNAMEKRYNQQGKERTDYINLQKSVMSNLAKNSTYASASAAQQTQMEIDAMRNALKLNPHLSMYAGDLGFSKTASGPVYDLTSDRE